MKGFLNPEQVLSQLELREDMLAAEFGCGAGVFALLLAKKLNQGKVYGLDVQEEPLSALQGKAKQERINNLEVVRCDLEEEGGSTLPDEFLDLVLISNVLFQAEDKKAILREAARVLKRAGQVLVIDWKKDSRFGPKNGRVIADEVKTMARELGLEFKKEFEAGIFHWGLVFHRP